jgi:hypothetical protein
VRALPISGLPEIGIVEGATKTRFVSGKICSEILFAPGGDIIASSVTIAQMGGHLLFARCRALCHDRAIPKLTAADRVDFGARQSPSCAYDAPANDAR